MLSIDSQALWVMAVAASVAADAVSLASCPGPDSHGMDTCPAFLSLGREIGGICQSSGSLRLLYCSQGKSLQSGPREELTRLWWPQEEGMK